MSMTPDDGGPAFPGPDHISQPDDIHEGMSLRDWFAGMALQGLVNLAGRDPGGESQLAYRYADAMLAAREVEQP